MTVAKRATSARLFFLKQFIRQPKMVGSVIPTSRTAVNALLDPVDWKRVRCVVEYGPGTGVFTRELLHRMGPQGRLVAIDTNPMFVEHLSRSLPDPRLICVRGSAADVETILARNGFAGADYVISGLPFSTLPCKVADEIADATMRAIQPGGAFLIYQYSLFVLPMLQRRFDRVETGRIWRCIPPARLFWAWKGAAGVSLAAAGSSVAA
jgi:phospholipid N-methyltransferase